MNNKFIFIDNYEPSIEFIYRDIRDDERIEYIEHPCKKLDSKILKLFRRVHLSRRVNTALGFEIPFKNLWGFCLEDYKWDDDTMYYIIQMNGYPVSPDKWNELKSKYNITYVLYMLDSLKMAPVKEYYINSVDYKYIFAYDNVDAKKTGFIYFPSTYSMISTSDSEIAEYDLVHIASRKPKRFELAMSVFKKLNSEGLALNYHITRVPRKERVFSDKVIYNKALSYDEVIDEVKKSNCILEILQQNQTGPTLRYYEAVCYNKKLLTTNTHIAELPFYNPDYMRTFSSPEDIDVDWVRERTNVDYGYDGSFSPVHIIDKILELEGKEERV